MLTLAVIGIGTGIARRVRPPLTGPGARSSAARCGSSTTTKSRTSATKELLNPLTDRAVTPWWRASRRSVAGSRLRAISRERAPEVLDLGTHGDDDVDRFLAVRASRSR
jgi:hypothetical protein